MAVKRASRNAKADKVFGQRRKGPKTSRAGLSARVSSNDLTDTELRDARLRRQSGGIMALFAPLR